MSKIDFKSEEYLQWLHELTTAGYERNIMIPTDHQDAIMGIYALKGDETISQCLDRYEKFCVRWIALHEPGGDFHVPGRVINLPPVITPLHDINQVVVSAGGLDIKVVGYKITFTIANKNWEMSVAELESMLESHQLLKDACKQIINSNATVDLNKETVSIHDCDEFMNGITNAKEALRRAD